MFKLSSQEVVSTPAESFDKLPEKPGVYTLRNREGTPVYVGKASSIKSRVLAHLRPNFDDPIALSLKEQINSADYIFTQTPVDALLLENILIKKHKPRYNIRLKDDKSYPYIKVTINEIYPRVFVTRRVLDDGSKYFGPYGNVKAAKRSVKYLRKLFPIRGCTLPLDGVRRFKSCIDYNIGLCKAPCIFAVTKQEYDSDVRKFQMYLEGKLVQLSKAMYSEMWRSSEKQDFEKAAKIRNDIRSLETTALKQRIVFPSQKRDKDIVTIARQEKITAAIIFQVRESGVVGREKFILDGTNPSTEHSEIISAFIKQHYGSSQAEPERIPPEIVVQEELPDIREIELLLTDLKNTHSNPIKITTGTQSEENRRLLQLAKENAILVLKEEESKDEVRKRERLRALKDLKEVLELNKLPKRIECFDISNIHGDEAVGAMTVLTEGFPEKSQYRKFKIKTVSGIDDYSMMAEMIGRRFRRLLEQSSNGKSSKFGEQPDLVVIDGGRGHLNAALDQMHHDGIFGIPTIALAKEEEVIFVPKRIRPIRLGSDSEALHVLQHIRDEAHRFGLSYHRRLRSRKMTSSVLDEVRGIGEKRKRNLLAHFGSIEALRRSSTEEVAQVAGINRKLAQSIVDSLNR